jgi:sugar lactone lactonase YvrE
MGRVRWLLVVLLLLVPAASVRAASVRSWAMASADEFGPGTLEGTALDGEGRITLAPRLETLWGPGEGIVWDVETDGAGGAFVALSSPTRVLHVVPGREPEFWHATGDETLVAAILPDGDGGVYMGLSPSGRLIHATAPGATREVATSEALFIWALAAAADGSVWIGTGFPGRLLRVDPGGELHTVFESRDDPVRCIETLDEGGIVFGTGGRGRVIRVADDGRPFVLFDADEAEIVTLETGGDGSLYALTAQGSKQIAAARSAASTSPDATVRVTATAPDPGPNGDDQPDPDGQAEAAQRRAEAQERAAAAQRFTTPPGGALYRITPDGDYRQLWQAQNEVPFALARLGDGTLLVATGDRGRIHAIDEAGRRSVLVEIPSDQASALGRDPDGAVLVGGTTDARVARIEPDLRDTGSYVSPVHDAGAAADWGRLRWDADRPAGSTVRASVRAGNTAEPDDTWSVWTPLDGDGTIGVETGLPVTRWCQARIELKPSRGGASPAVRRVELVYLPHNRRPAITEVTVQPAGVVWTHAATQSSRTQGPVVADDPVSRRTAAAMRPATVAKPVRKWYELGARTISWTAADPDGDRLAYRVEIRREGATAWIPLATGLEQPFFGWDARGMPDGLYRVRLVADDARDNPDGKGLTDARTSAAFRIDNTRPSVGAPQVRRSGERLEVEFVASDPGGSVVVAEAAVDAGEWQPLEPLDGVADEAEERYQLSIEPLGPAEAEQVRTVKVRVTDASGNVGGDAWALDGDD